jgi:hypothetical protein
MVDRLPALTRAIATLRSSLNMPTAQPRVAAAHTHSARPQGPRTTKAAASHVATLASRLSALRPDDPQRTRKALRLFIEAVLLDEFGGALILDADFQHLVDNALSALEADESLGPMLSQAAKELFPQG